MPMPIHEPAHWPTETERLAWIAAIVATAGTDETAEKDLREWTAWNQRAVDALVCSRRRRKQLQDKEWRRD